MSDVARCFCEVYIKMGDMFDIDMILGGKGGGVGVKMGVQKVDAPHPIGPHRPR